MKSGEIVGIAGVSGNGQSELVEALSGQRPIRLGQVLIDNQNFEPGRDHFDRFKVFGLPEEPLKNAPVPAMSVAENMAFRRFDTPPMASWGWWLSPAPMRLQALDLIARYNVKTPNPETAVADLSGGNVQRAVLARELSADVDELVLLVEDATASYYPHFKAATIEMIRAQGGIVGWTTTLAQLAEDLA